ncbi:MAG: CHASE2 domain-containing protein [Microscillaceae bacterium]|jgi:hypothetical protein|nr:CHASE2 domain-containing protein [Microscillaceae bacterium]
MFWLTFFIQSFPYSLPDEYALVRYSSVLRNVILGLETKPDTTRFLFINVAWDKVMADYFDPAVPEYPVGVEPITDRKKLIDLLTLLAHRKDYKSVVFDINFKGKTEYDSVLTTKINAMPNFLVSYHRDEKDKPDYPDLAIKKKLGLSDLEKVYDEALKFKIFYNDSLKSTPLLMYELIYKKKFTHDKWGHWIDGKPVFNSFILDYRIRNFDYTSGKYTKLHLGEFLGLMTDSLGNANPSTNPENLDLFKNRIIFVGDFEDRDIHDTIYGKIPGPLILLDAFLALEAGDNVITLPFLLLLFVSYFFISYVTFYYQQIYGNWLKIITFKKLQNPESFLESLTIFLAYFALVSLTSFFLFNIHIGVLGLAFYLNLAEKAKHIIWNFMDRKKSH